MRTTIEFGGFYGSVHEQLVESAVEMWHMDEDGNIENDTIDNWDWRESNNKYMREWTNIFSEWLKDDYDLDIDFTNLELISPKYYNFETDKIDADITERELDDLLGKFDNDVEFMQYLKQATTSYDGYISFYDYEQAKANKDGILPQYLLRYLANKFNERDLYDYYDRQNCYERIA
jgi:hypothetical protein